MRIRVLALVATAGLLVGAAPAPLPDLAESDWDDLRAGEVVVQQEAAPPGHYVVTMSALLSETPDAVWDVVVDCAHFQDFMPRMRESEASETPAGDRLCRTVSDLPFPLSDFESQVLSRTREDRDGTRHRYFEQVPGDWSFEESVGHWAVIPLADGANRTLLRYRIAVVPRIKLPKFIVRAAQERTAPDMFAAISAEARRRTRPSISSAMRAGTEVPPDHGARSPVADASSPVAGTSSPVPGATSPVPGAVSAAPPIAP